MHKGTFCQMPYYSSYIQRLKHAFWSDWVVDPATRGATKLTFFHDLKQDKYFFPHRGSSRDSCTKSSWPPARLGAVTQCLQENTPHHVSTYCLKRDKQTAHPGHAMEFKAGIDLKTRSQGASRKKDDASVTQSNCDWRASQ